MSTSRRWTGAVVAIAIAAALPAVGSSASAEVPGSLARCDELPVTVAGTPGDDVVVGTTGADVISAGAGNDTISGLGGADVICPGPGNDATDAGDGNDRVVLEPGGNDTVTDTTGVDTVDLSNADHAIALDLAGTVVQTIDHAGNTLQLQGDWEAAIGGPAGDVFFVTPGAGFIRSLDGAGGDDDLIYRAEGQAVTVAAGVIDHPTAGNVTYASLTAHVVDQPPIVLDDGDAGYTAPGFTARPGGGFGGDADTSGAGAGNTATWSFTGLEPGIYAVATTWSASSDQATDAPYTVRNGGAGGAVAITRDLDQEVAPADYTAEAVGWETLGVVQPTGSTITVQLTDVGADDDVVADAVRLEPLGPALWPGSSTPTWLPDPAALGLDAPPPAGLLSITFTSGGFLVTGLPSTPPPGDPPVTGYYVVLKPDGQVVDTPTLPVTVQAEDGLGPVRVRLIAHSLVQSSTPLEVFPTPSCSSGFPDVPASHTFCEEIDDLAEQGVTGGYADGRFHPGDTVTRQALSAWFHRAAGEPLLPACSTAPFSDVPTTHAFCEQIDWMVDEGITNGFADGTFRPTAEVSRQALSAWFHRFAGSPPLPPCSTAPFDDVPTSHPFCPEITWASDEGLVNGYPDGTFRPGAAVSRQAAAAFFVRFLDPTP